MRSRATDISERVPPERRGSVVIVEICALVGKQSKINMNKKRRISANDLSNHVIIN